MRHETCLTCQRPGLIDEDQRTMIMAGESLGPFTHHHHIVKCGQCKHWWFDDLVPGAFGPVQPVPDRRGTQLCGCPDGLPIYTQVAIYVSEPETSCACTKESLDAFPVQAHYMPD